MKEEEGYARWARGVERSLSLAVASLFFLINCTKNPDKILTDVFYAA
jgi:hypothetical protein